jgi:hypothetical protein
MMKKKKWPPTYLQPIGGALLPAQLNHPGCRDEQALDGYYMLFMSTMHYR